MSTSCASRSAIEAHRTRLASWKRSMPPLSPKIIDFRGPRRTNAVRGKGDKVWYQQIHKSMNKFAEVEKK